MRWTFMGLVNELKSWNTKKPDIYIHNTVGSALELWRTVASCHIYWQGNGEDRIR